MASETSLGLTSWNIKTSKEGAGEMAQQWKALGALAERRRTQVWFPAPAWLLTTVYTPVPSILFCPLPMWGIDMHAANIHVHKRKQNILKGTQNVPFSHSNSKVIQQDTSRRKPTGSYEVIVLPLQDYHIIPVVSPLPETHLLTHFTSQVWIFLTCRLLSGKPGNLWTRETETYSTSSLLEFSLISSPKRITTGQICYAGA